MREEAVFDLLEDSIYVACVVKLEGTQHLIGRLDPLAERLVVKALGNTLLFREEARPILIENEEMLGKELPVGLRLQ